MHVDVREASPDGVENASGKRCGFAKPVPAWAVAWFAALMLMTVGVRLFDPTGWVGSDDVSYYSAAEHILAGETIERVHHHYARMAVVLPVTASVWLFGHSPFAVALPMLIASTLCVVLTVVLGRLVWGWWEGLFAATVLSVMPYYLVLSTVAYPDVHACFWITLAIIVAWMSADAATKRRARLLGATCGLLIGLAISAKVLSAAAIPVVIYILWTRRRRAPGERLVGLAAIACGGLVVLVVEGVFYAWVADDFLFRLHALRKIQSGAGYFPASGYHEAVTLNQLVWDRLMLPMHPGLSGWGKIGLAFWPACCVALLVNRRGRPVALWALAAYLLIAFIPVSFKNGLQPFPTFYGRHILAVSIPFALCLAWLLRSSAQLALRRVWINNSWPLALAAVFAILYLRPNDVRGFGDRDGKRLGTAITSMISAGQLDGDGDVFMTPSMYWRYHILFPTHLKSRLRVAADGAAPSWWRHTAVGIASRWRPLPPPDKGYLLATPRQLRGEPEFWDYRVGLPQEGLESWRALHPLASYSRLADKSVGPTPRTGDDSQILLVLLSGKTSEASVLAQGNPLGEDG